MEAAPITEQDIERLVPEFYARVRADAVLGPIFDGAIEDWPHHLEKLKAFWSSVMLTSGRYKGQPMVAHLRHQGRERSKLRVVVEAAARFDGDGFDTSLHGGGDTP